MQQAQFSVDLEALLEAGSHFGHQARRWNPRMADFIYAERDGVHIFDLAKTAAAIEEACKAIYDAASLGKRIIFVGTKRQAQEIVREEAKAAEAMYITNRWPGGLISNWEQVGKSVKKLNTRKAEKAEGKYKVYTKKENVLIDREIARLERFFGGVATLQGAPDIVVVTDINKDIVAIKEARAKGVFLIAIADSNTNPDLVDIAIPANDDAVGSIKLIVHELTSAYKQGKASSAKKEVAAPVVAAAEEKKN